MESEEEEGEVCWDAEAEVEEVLFAVEKRSSGVEDGRRQEGPDGF